MTTKTDRAKQAAQKIRKYATIATIVLGVASFVQEKRASKK